MCTDCDPGRYDNGEKFDDLDGDCIYDKGEPFVDKGNGKRDIAEKFEDKSFSVFTPREGY